MVGERVGGGGLQGVFEGRWRVVCGLPVMLECVRGLVRRVY